MSVFSKYGIKSKGKYLFYTVDKETAVIIGIKRKKKLDLSNIVIPQKIGKYIVRGISDPYSREKVMRKNGVGCIASWKFDEKLSNYIKLRFFENYVLPETIEYIGVLPENNKYDNNKKIHDRFVIPKNVSYVENSKISTKTLVLPKDIKYIGKITEQSSLENIFTDDKSCDEGVPHYSLSQYRGEKDEEELFHSKIVESAFCGHCNLKNIILPDGIQEIEEGAFSHIGEVEHFRFPKSLEKISDSAFILTNFTGTFKYPSDFPAGLENNNYNFRITGKILLEDLEQLENMIKSENSQGNAFTEFASELDLSSLEGRLPDHAFHKKGVVSAYKFQTILLGDNITEIGESAFEGNAIKSLKLPSKLLSIRKNAFKGCKYLTKLELPDSLEIVEEGAFETECDILISASEKTTTRISEQKGYIEYSQKIAALNSKCDEFIQKYKDYFAGKITENIPNVQDLVKNWVDYGQNLIIYKKLRLSLMFEPIDKKVFDKLIDRAQAFGLNSEEKEFKRIYTERIAKLSKSNRPKDWLTGHRLDPDNYLFFYKIVEYLLMRYETGVPKQFLRYIDSFMALHYYSMERNFFFNYKCYKEPFLPKLKTLYEERVGNRGYEDFREVLRISPHDGFQKFLFDLDRDLIEDCKKACAGKSPYSYLWCELAVAFSPNFKPPKCPPKPKVEKAKPQKTVSAPNKTNIPQSFNSDIEFLNTDTTYTYSGTPSFRYTEEERRRAQEIISDYNAQKDAETYVAYLLDDIDAPSNLGSLVDEFSGIDWSEYGDV